MIAAYIPHTHHPLTSEHALIVGIVLCVYALVALYIVARGER